MVNPQKIIIFAYKKKPAYYAGFYTIKIERKTIGKHSSFFSFTSKGCSLKSPVRISRIFETIELKLFRPGCVLHE